MGKKSNSKTTKKQKTNAKKPDFADKIIYKNVKDLKPFDKNPKQHSKEQIQKISESIIEFGFNNPILIADDNEIIAGHGRILAAKKLKLKEVPTLTLSHLNKTQRKAYVIADNKLSEGQEWDENLVTEILTELKEENFDLDLTGFAQEEIDDLLGMDIDLNDPEPAGADPEENPENDPQLPDGPKEFYKMVFTFTDEQRQQVLKAIDKAKKKGEFIKTGNPNDQANAIARMAEAYK